MNQNKYEAMMIRKRKLAKKRLTKRLEVVQKAAERLRIRWLKTEDRYKKLEALAAALRATATQLDTRYRSEMHRANVIKSNLLSV